MQVRKNEVTKNAISRDLADEATGDKAAFPLSQEQNVEFEKQCKQIKELIEDTESNLWEIGDMILRTRGWYVELLEDKGIKSEKAESKANEALRKGLKLSFQRIGQYAKTAEFFTQENRVLEASFYTHEQARKVNDKTLEKDRRCTAEEIAEAMRSGNHSTRDIMAWIKNKQAKDIAKKASQRAIKWQPKLNGLVNAPHHSSWEELIPNIPDGTINGLVWADPPFGVFKRDRTRPIENCGGTYMTKADNMTEEDALATTLRLFELLPSKLAKGTPLFIMQSGNSVDNPRVIEAALKNGWHPHTPLTWVKTSDSSKPGTPSCSQMGDAFGSVTQRILVFSLEERLHRVGTYPNGNVFYGPNVSRAAAARIGRGLASSEDHHGFEHPWQLVAEVARTVLPENSRQICFEPFGCSAPASVAAIHNGWDWIYAESYPNNFSLGEGRLSDALNGDNEEEKGVKSPIKYYGGKTNMAKNIIPLMPPHKTYCELFGGSAEIGRAHV